MHCIFGKPKKQLHLYICTKKVG